MPFLFFLFFLCVVLLLWRCDIHSGGRAGDILFCILDYYYYYTRRRRRRRRRILFATRTAATAATAVPMAEVECISHGLQIFQGKKRKKEEKREEMCQLRIEMMIF